MTDFIVEFTRDGANLRMAVRFGNVDDDTLQRAPLALDKAEIDRLRSGDIDPPTAVTLTNNVSAWLLNPGLRGYLNTALSDNAPFRLVFQTHRELEDALADVPFELLDWGATDPVVLKPRVRGIVHAATSKAGAAAAPAEMRSWPLKILIVRSNPVDLGNAVPAAAGLRDDIQTMAAAYGPGNVQVTLLSREPGVDKTVTFSDLRTELKRQAYDVLVFLGHGDIREGFQGLPPVSVLQFETPDGQSAEPKNAAQLKVELQNRPVPVVLLAGCLTAAQIPLADQPSLRESFPLWMRGNQGVAQALVTGDSGVQVAIGMRHKLETTDALAFLKAFFKSLLLDEPGDVEGAVRAGRQDLFANAPFPPSWSAPVIFRRLSPEPLFDFLRKAPPQLDARDQLQQERRGAAWEFLKALPRSGRDGGAVFAYQTIDGAEADVCGRTMTNGVPLLMPSRGEAGPGETVKITLKLVGNLLAREVRGKIVFNDPALLAKNAHSSQALRDAGFRAKIDVDVPGEVGFTIEHAPTPPTPKGVAPLPAGPLLEFELEVGALPALYVMQVDEIAMDPPRPHRGWSNAVIVSPS